MITVTLLKKLAVVFVILIIKVTNLTRCSNKNNKLKNIYNIESGTRDIANMNLIGATYIRASKLSSHAS